MNKWVKYDIAAAQIRYLEFEAVGNEVRVDRNLFEQWLREKGFEPEDEFNAKMEKLLKAVFK